MAQHVETATDSKHTHKDLGLIMVNVYGFVFQRSNGSSRRAPTDKQTDRQTNKQTNGRTDATKRIISPALRSIIRPHCGPVWFSEIPDLLLCSALFIMSCIILHKSPKVFNPRPWVIYANLGPGAAQLSRVYHPT